MAAKKFDLGTALSGVKRNLKAETEGVWISIPDIEQDLDFKIISADNDDYNEYVAKKIRQYKEQHRRKTVPEKVLSAILAEGTAKFLVVDWRGDAVKGVPFDREQVVAIFTNPEYSLVADYVHEQTSKAATFRQELVEEDAKNS